jgi:hypothetical protein
MLPWEGTCFLFFLLKKRRKGAKRSERGRGRESERRGRGRGRGGGSTRKWMLIRVLMLPWEGTCFPFKKAKEGCKRGVSEEEGAMKYAHENGCNWGPDTYFVRMGERKSGKGRGREERKKKEARRILFIYFFFFLPTSPLTL